MSGSRPSGRTSNAINSTAGKSWLAKRLHRRKGMHAAVVLYNDLGWYGCWSTELLKACRSYMVEPLRGLNFQELHGVSQ